MLPGFDFDSLWPRVLAARLDQAGVGLTGPVRWFLGSSEVVRLARVVGSHPYSNYKLQVVVWVYLEDMCFLCMANVYSVFFARG